MHYHLESCSSINSGKTDKRAWGPHMAQTRKDVTTRYCVTKMTATISPYRPITMAKPCMATKAVKMIGR
uniref:Uncharacterized protein n=1 Tax=Romanomermis culicivorax TaxID=13658 RepID=A0A915JTG7_ROMCU